MRSDSLIQASRLRQEWIRIHWLKNLSLPVLSSLAPTSRSCDSLVQKRQFQQVGQRHWLKGSVSISQSQSESLVQNQSQQESIKISLVPSTTQQGESGFNSRGCIAGFRVWITFSRSVQNLSASQWASHSRSLASASLSSRLLRNQLFCKWIATSCRVWVSFDVSQNLWAHHRQVNPYPHEAPRWISVSYASSFSAPGSPSGLIRVFIKNFLHSRISIRLQTP